MLIWGFSAPRGLRQRLLFSRLRNFGRKTRITALAKILLWKIMNVTVTTIITWGMNVMFFEMMELKSDAELNFAAKKREAKELEELIAEANMRMYMLRSAYDSVC